jgi:hypothetical protein
VCGILHACKFALKEGIARVPQSSQCQTMAQVAALGWHGHILSSGCGDGSIWHHDMHVAWHKVMELLGHSGEVCGLKWRADGELLASGGNDNVVNIWDGRVGDVTEGSRGVARWTKRNHTAAVKAIVPLQPCPSCALMFAFAGPCVVPMAAIPLGKIALIEDASASDFPSMVTAQERIPDDTWISNECGHGARIPATGPHRGDPGHS